MEQKTELEIVYDHEVHKLTYRALAEKYGISHSQIHRMIISRQKEEENAKEFISVLAAETALPDNVKDLKEALRLALLKIELQDLMIDISSKELGIDLRKKHGTRQPK
jgi:hypothetical protein